MVPIEPNDWGHRKSCHEMKHPIDGTAYDWADKLGCVAKKSDNGMTTFVKEGECGAVGGTWHGRAKSKEECEDDRGSVCTHPFDEWRVFGMEGEKCDQCSYRTTHPTKWRSGVWSDSAETPLYWVERSFSSKNAWEERSFDSTAFHGFVKNSISRFVADAFKKRVYCELGAYNAFIPAIISMCGPGGEEEQTVVQYDLTTSTVPCGDLGNQPPIETYEGSVSFADASCTNNESFAETTMGKVVPITSSGGRRMAASSGVCAPYALIKNSYGIIVGQRLGSGISVTGVEGASLCIKPTLSESAVCPEYIEFGISTVDGAGSYSVPLQISTTVNQQGEICFEGSESGVTYVPVKLMSGWEAVSGTEAPTTRAPTSSPSLQPTVVPSSSPSLHPTQSADPTVSSEPSTIAPSTSPSQVEPSASPSTEPSASPSAAPSDTPSDAPTLDSASAMMGRGLLAHALALLALGACFYDLN